MPPQSQAHKSRHIHAATRPTHDPLVVSLKSRIQQQQEFTRVLLQLSQSQQELIEQAEYGSLLSLLQQKQAVIEALHEIRHGANNLVETWRAERSHLPDDIRSQCEQWLEQTEADFYQLLSMERQATGSIEYQHQQTQTDLAKISQALHVKAAYESTDQPQRFDMHR